MKAKYILRGLGLGMIITAVVMGTYTRNAVAAARVAVLQEYGIGEEAALVETLIDVEGSDNTVPDTVPHNEELESEIQSLPGTAEATEQSGQDAAPGAALTDESETRQEEAESVSVAAEGQGNTVTVEILKGDDSSTVARKLYNAGLVENAAEYDAFLMQHGYDKKLNPGTKTLHAADSWQDIAEELAKK